MIGFIRKHSAWLLLALLVALFIPWLGEAMFNTKGEPREAIVAMSMINSGDWILPVSFDYEIPYKPPFLAWCIAAFSLLTGSVDEFTSRLPSAIAAICMAMATYGFFARHTKSRRFGILVALVMVTSVEVWRAASACRVDMLNTAFMVGAIYSLYNFFDRKCRLGLPWLAIALMTCAFLTKGPVGVALPCLVAGVFRLIVGDRFFPLFFRLAGAGIVSCIVPALWYYAAYERGGDEFMRLALEENVGRLTGTMSYDSHVNPFYYNFITVFAGMAPYTLLCLLALFAAKWGRKPSNATSRQLWQRLRNIEPVKLYSVVVTVVIFVFYCIPKSKRSVYLLPIYPFLAYFVTLLIVWLIQNHKRVLRIYSCIIGLTGLGLVIAIPLAVSGVIKSMPGFGTVSVLGSIIIVLTFWAALMALWCTFRGSYKQTVAATVGATITILVSLSSVVLPRILNSKTDYYVAKSIERDYPTEELYSYVDIPMLHLYEINFYMGDRLKIFDKEIERGTVADEGLVLLNEADEKALIEKFSDSYDLSLIRSYTKQAPMLARPKRLTTMVYYFKKRQD